MEEEPEPYVRGAAGALARAQSSSDSLSSQQGVSLPNEVISRAESKHSNAAQRTGECQ
jgi:hypothetical protein